MHTGHCNPLHLPEDEQVDRLSNQLITGKLIQIDQNKLLFPALISTNIFANDNLTIDFEAHISTKVDYSFNDVSKQFKTIISFQMRLHLLITLVRSSEYFRFIEFLRTCIMASQSTGNLKVKLHISTLGLRSSKSFCFRCYMHGFVSYVLYLSCMSFVL